MALAGEISDSLEGRGVALLDDKAIAVDLFDSWEDADKAIEAVVDKFIASRKEGAHYSAERSGNRIIVHSADPVKGMSRRRTEKLPPNLFKCPWCPFVTPHEELYVIHYRSHGALIGAI
jgi:hypothetical protein